MEKIHPITQPTERQLLDMIRRSMMICDPHAAMQLKSSTNHSSKNRPSSTSKNQAA